MKSGVAADELVHARIERLGGGFASRLQSCSAGKIPSGRRSLWLLAPEPEILRRVTGIRAKRIDVNSAAALVTRVNRQLLACTSFQDIEEHAFDTGFVKVLVLAKRHNVLQERSGIDPWPGVFHQHAAAVRLAGDRTQAAQHMGMQSFAYNGRGVRTKQVCVDFPA